MMLNKRIYIGNFPFSTTRDELANFFAPRSIVDIKICMDRETGRPRGFGFVEFATEAEATDAIEKHNGEEMGGRALVISIAAEKKQFSGAPSRGIPLRPRENKRQDEGRGRNGHGGSGRGNIERDW